MYLPSTGDADAHPRLTTCNASGIAIRAHHPYIPTSAHTYNRPHTMRHMPRIHTYARIGRGNRADICRQAYHVFNRGLAAGLPVDRVVPVERTATREPQPLAGCTSPRKRHSIGQLTQPCDGMGTARHNPTLHAPKGAFAWG